MFVFAILELTLLNSLIYCPKIAVKNTWLFWSNWPTNLRTFSSRKHLRSQKSVSSNMILLINVGTLKHCNLPLPKPRGYLSAYVCSNYHIVEVPRFRENQKFCNAKKWGSAAHENKKRVPPKAEALKYMSTLHSEFRESQKCLANRAVEVFCSCAYLLHPKTAFEVFFFNSKSISQRKKEP